MPVPKRERKKSPFFLEAAINKNYIYCSTYYKDVYWHMLFYSHGTKKKSKKLACNANRKIMSITKKQTKQKNSPPNKKTPHQSKTNKPMHLGVCILDLKEISLHSNEWSPAVEQPFVTV